MARPGQRRGRRAKVQPPLNFSTVAPGLHRSGFPIPLNFPFLRDLNLKSILCLSPKLMTEDLRGFCRDEGIELFEEDIGDNRVAGVLGRARRAGARRADARHTTPTHDARPLSRSRRALCQ